MRLLRAAVAICVVLGAVAALSLPSVASADWLCDNTSWTDGCAHGPSDPCAQDPTLPTCVNDAFDEAVLVVEHGRSTYNRRVQPLLDGGACLVYETATGQPCAGLVPNPLNRSIELGAAMSTAAAAAGGRLASIDRRALRQASLVVRCLLPCA